jgi:hypothetical protein
VTANTHKNRHSREGGNPQARIWIPAFAGMTAIIRLPLNHAKTLSKATLALNRSYCRLGLELASDEVGRHGHAAVAVQNAVDVAGLAGVGAGAGVAESAVCHAAQALA